MFDMDLLEVFFGIKLGFGFREGVGWWQWEVNFEQVISRVCYRGKVYLYKSGQSKIKEIFILYCKF